METTFLIFAVLLSLITLWEYFTGKVIDVAFISILARKEEVKRKFLQIILVKLFIWLLTLAMIFLVYRAIFVIGPGDLRRVRTYFLISFLVVIGPFIAARKWYASWVARISMNERKIKRQAQ